MMALRLRGRRNVATLYSALELKLCFFLLRRCRLASRHIVTRVYRQIDKKAVGMCVPVYLL